jgi:hypothetical protein
MPVSPVGQTNRAGRKHGGQRGLRQLASPPTTLVSVQRGSRESGIPYTTLLDLIRRGHLASVRLPDCRRIWIKREDLQRLIDRSREVAS